MRTAFYIADRQAFYVYPNTNRILDPYKKGVFTLVQKHTVPVRQGSRAFADALLLFFF